MGYQLSHQSPCFSVAVGKVSLAVPCQAAAPGALDPLALGHCLAAESSPSCVQLPRAFTDGPMQEGPPAGCRCQSLYLVTLAAFQGNPFLLLKPPDLCLGEHTPLSSLMIPTSSAGSGGHAMSVLLSTQVPGTWAANYPCQVATPQHGTPGRKAFMPHTSEETPAEPSTCSEKLVMRARPSWKR